MARGHWPLRQIVEEDLESPGTSSNNGGPISPTHYESKLPLELPVPTGVDYHRIEFRMEDPQYLYLLSTDREYRIRLYYDYAMIDGNRLQAHFREVYDT